MPKWGNERLCYVYKEDVLDVISSLQLKLTRIFALDMGLTDDDYDNFLKYWDERIDLEVN